MKRILLCLIFCGLSLSLKAQEISVEKSIFGIQTGFLGIWGHHEAKLSNSIVLRAEIGFDSGIWGGDFYEKTGFLLTPVITAEPRWYYNLKKRESKSKRIEGNSGNFIALKTSYHPDWFVISNYSDVNIISDISIIPTWGIRRNIDNHFNYEAGFGVGYHYIFAENAGFIGNSNKGEVDINLHLRIGYRF